MERFAALLQISLVALFLPSIVSGSVASGNCFGSCSLHPDIRGRIGKDLAWLDDVGGVTDSMIRNISLLCDTKIRHQCNVKAVRLMIKDGEIYLNSLHPDWRLGAAELIGFLVELYEASKVYRLPDVEFAFNGDDDSATPAFDWVDMEKRKTVFHGGPFPVLAWSKHKNNFAILVPYSGAFRCSDDSFDALMSRLEDVRRVHWRDKKEVAFGRWNMFCAIYNYEMPPLPSGEHFECPREHLPRLTKGNEELLDVHYLGDLATGRRAAPVPLQHQNTYKYIVSTDGWAISSKFDKYLLLGSTIIKAASSRIGYYYDALKPGEHYLDCMNSSKSDLIDRVRWLREHDDRARAMATAAQTFAVQHLHRGARLCFYKTLLEELSKRMKYTPDCAKRQLCLPLGRFLEFLSTYEKTAHICRYAEVLMRHRTQPEPSAADFPDAKIKEMLDQDKFWPRDNDIPPLNHEPYFPGAMRRVWLR